MVFNERCPSIPPYLASDKRRAEALATLKQTIGTHPEYILAAQHSTLAAVGKAGILPDVSAEKLLTIEKIAYEEFDSDLRLACCVKFGAILAVECAWSHIKW